MIDTRISLDHEIGGKRFIFLRLRITRSEKNQNREQSKTYISQVNVHDLLRLESYETEERVLTIWATESYRTDHSAQVRLLFRTMGWPRRTTPTNKRRTPVPFVAWRSVATPLKN